ncbi:MAG: hypothetical protein AB8H79_21475 [Myxococcota bacterium]
MNFCSDFDATLAQDGPAAVFLPDRDQELRFDAEWTRDAWGRHPGPHAISPTWTLLRDTDSGFVLLALVSSPTLLPDHPRMEVRRFESEADAREARALFGRPPITEHAW